MLLWEIMSYGQTPYDDMDNHEVCVCVHVCACVCVCVFMHIHVCMCVYVLAYKIIVM